MGTSDANPDPTTPQPAPAEPAATEGQPLAQGATAQEQATGQASTGSPAEAPTEAPGQAPEQGDPAEPATPTFEEQQAAAAAAQSPGEPQVVPEGRPQAFQSTELKSDSQKRAEEADPGPMDQAAYDRANSDEAKAEAAKNSRTPNLLVGQRVQIIEPNSEAGRMAYVLQIDYADGIQGMLAASGQPEARFAEVQDYVVRTRDGRSDILVVKPDEVKPLDDTQGWGRGQI